VDRSRITRTHSFSFDFNGLRFSRRPKRLDRQLIPQYLHKFARSESIDDLRQWDPITEPLSLRISYDRQRF
jgi:hypothetical protein